MRNKKKVHTRSVLLSKTGRPQHAHFAVKLTLFSLWGKLIGNTVIHQIVLVLRITLILS